MTLAALFSQAEFIRKALLPPCHAKDALGLALASGSVETVRDALIAARTELRSLAWMVDEWVSAYQDMQVAVAVEIAA